MTKHLPDLHCVDELKNFVADILLSWCHLICVLGFSQLLVKYLGAVHQKGELSLQNKSDWVLG